MEILRADPAAAELLSLPYAQQLLTVLSRLLFMPGFTINLDMPDKLDHGVYLNKLWYGSYV